jgi:hypothetical protein
MSVAAESEKFELGKIAGKQAIKQRGPPAFALLYHNCAEACAETAFCMPGHFNKASQHRRDKPIHFFAHL